MHKSRVYNFSAGPAALPEAILQQAQDELLDWQNKGVSVMEISHRHPAFINMLREAEHDLRDLMQIPKHYAVLFLPGATRTQFAMLLLNLLADKKRADYLLTGIWSSIAAEEAKRYCTVNCVASSEQQSYTTIPKRDTWQLDPKAAYFHYTSNETISGVALVEPPDVANVPIVSDMTSSILSMPIEVNRFGLIYAGTQKNIAPAGLTIIIVRHDLLGKPLPITPSVYDYTLQNEKGSLYCTLPTFNCYMAGLMFRWIKKQGGVSVMYEKNQRQAKKLYQFIDENDFYHNPIDSDYRSSMNVIFTLTKPELESQFLEEAKQAGLFGLAGHYRVGGLRASLYNAMTDAGVDALLEFMEDFARKAC